MQACNSSLLLVCMHKSSLLLLCMHKPRDAATVYAWFEIQPLRLTSSVPAAQLCLLGPAFSAMTHVLSLTCRPCHIPGLPSLGSYP